MNFFKNKLNIFLTVVLVLLIGVGVVLGVKFFAKPAVLASDFSTMTEDEIIAWANNNNVNDLIEITHEYDEVIEKGNVIYQSIKAGEEINEKILIIVSDGPDISNMIEIPVSSFNNLDSFDTWARQNNLTNIKYEYKIDQEKEDGTIISIEPVLVRTSDLVTVTSIQNGTIDVPDFSFMSDEEIEKWSKDNDVKVTFKAETSELSKGSFIKQSVAAGKKVSIGDSIVITVSGGKEDEKSAVIHETKYLGMAEEDFLKELKELGFTNVKKIGETDSKKYKAGTICYYLPDGKQNFDTKIEYKVVKGEAETVKTAKINETKYLGMKEEDFLKELEELGFTNVVKIEETTSKKYSAGTICYYLPDGEQKTDTKIEYKVVKGSDTVKTAYIHETKYLGVKEADFIKALKDLGFTNLVKVDEISSAKYAAGTICYYLPDGNQKTDTKIEYKVVKGSDATVKTEYIDPDKYLGYSETNFLSELKSLGYTKLTKIGETYNDNQAAGTICYYLPDGNQKIDTEIKYKLSLGKKPVEEPQPEKESSIIQFSIIQPNYSKGSYEETKNSIYEYLVTDGGFTNVTIKGVSADMLVGQIVSISVNGNTSYTAGKYKVSTPIVVEICNKDLN